MTTLVGKVKIGVRLSVALGTVLALLLGVGAMGLVGLRSQERAAQSARDAETLSRYVQEMKFRNADISGWQASYAFESYRNGMAAAVADTGESRKGFLASEQAIEQLLQAAPPRS